MAVSFFIGILLAYFLFKKRYDIKTADKFIDYSPYVILISIIGARLFYVIGDFKFYFNNLSEIIKINHGGLSIFGAIIFGLISLYIFSKINKFDFLRHCDVLAVVFPLCQAFGRIGNYFNQEAFGSNSDSFIKLYVDSAFRPSCMEQYEYFHPTFLYESVLNLILFFVLFFIFFKFKNLKKGTIFCLYLIFYSIIRFLVESIRVDSILNIAGIPIAQIISIIIFFVALVALILINKKRAQN